MPPEEATSVLAALDTTKPFLARVHYIRCVAAVCSLFPAEVARKVIGANKEVFKVLWSAWRQQGGV